MGTLIYVLLSLYGHNGSSPGAIMLVLFTQHPFFCMNLISLQGIMMQYGIILTAHWLYSKKYM